MGIRQEVTSSTAAASINRLRASVSFCTALLAMPVMLPVTLENSPDSPLWLSSWADP